MADLAEVLRSLPLGRRPRAGVVGNQHVRPMALALRHHAVLKPASSSSEDVNFRSARIDPSKNSISPRAMASSRCKADRTASSAERRERPRRRPTYGNDSPLLGAGPVWPGRCGAGSWRNSRPASSSSSRASALACLGCPGAPFRLGRELVSAPACTHIRLRQRAAPDHLVAQPQADPDGGKSVAMTGRLQSRRVWHPQETGSLRFSSSPPRSHDRVVPPTQAPKSRFAGLGAPTAAHPAGRAHRRSFSRRQVPASSTMSVIRRGVPPHRSKPWRTKATPSAGLITKDREIVARATRRRC
jgi:hypothetical protein